MKDNTTFQTERIEKTHKSLNTKNMVLKYDMTSSQWVHSQASIRSTELITQHKDTNTHTLYGDALITHCGPRHTFPRGYHLTGTKAEVILLTVSPFSAKPLDALSSSGTLFSSCLFSLHRCASVLASLHRLPVNS